MSDDGRNIIRARWDGATFHPAGNIAIEKSRKLADGEFLGIELSRDRSMNSHRHQFAEIKNLWMNIPEDLQNMPYAATPETFRKYALLVCGYYDVETIACANPGAAERAAALLSRLATRSHGYAVTDVKENVARCYTPKSQSAKAMGSADFQKSKTAVLDWCASIVSPE